MTVTANIGVVSDYRFRGLSLSDRDPALQGGIDLTSRSGLFAGTWASTIADYGGSNLEVDLYAGYSGAAAGLDYTVTVLGYVYPGGDAVNYVELQGSVGKIIGPVSLEAEVAYTPDQWNTTKDNLYVSAKAEIAVPATPLTVLLRGGRENGSYDDKWDWEAGLSYSHNWLTVSASYVDSNYGGVNEAGRLGRAGLVGSVVASF